MEIGYIRVSKTDGSQNLDLQKDALINAGVKPNNIYEDQASGKKDNRPGRDLKHLINTVQDLAKRDIGFKVLTGQGANIDTTTANGRLIFGIFAALSEFEAELIRERTMAGLAAARARGRNGGRKFALTKAQLRLA